MKDFYWTIMRQLQREAMQRIKAQNSISLNLVESTEFCGLQNKFDLGMDGTSGGSRTKGGAAEGLHVFTFVAPNPKFRC